MKIATLVFVLSSLAAAALVLVSSPDPIPLAPG